ncbi:ABC transporter [Streptomyces sp. TLI_55]|uniref:ABC transporter n=1 Tax=Streptomyces sp. TLI_55 TaxID=1938861 RepID=UPI000BE2D7B8|nr:ABC transporter [Streptomyces sp. TLI_55]
MRLIGALLVPVLRTLPWRALGASGAVGLLIVSMARLSDTADEPLALNLLRAAVLAFALGLAFVLDDPARHTTTPVPTRRPVRHALRVALVAPVAAAWWTATVLLVPDGIRPPVGDVTLEAGAAFTLALAASAAAIRFTQAAEPGQAVAGAVLTTAVLGLLLWPGRWALFVGPQDPRWAQAHDRWGLVLVGAVVVWGVCGPEPLRRRVVLKATRA